MVLYRRIFQKGGTYFFTATLKDRNSTLLIKHINLLKQSFQETQFKYPFKIPAIVILPEHIHCVWELPEDDMNYSYRWRLIKSKFTQAVMAKNENFKINKRGKYDIWAKRFWEHLIRDDYDFENHINYIHYNPVKHNLVDNPVDWKFSSIHKFIAEGNLPKSWGAGKTFDKIRFGSGE